MVDTNAERRKLRRPGRREAVPRRGIAEPERSSAVRKWRDHGVTLKSPATISGSVCPAANDAMVASSALRSREFVGPSGQCRCTPSTVTCVPCQSSVTRAARAGPSAIASDSAETIGQRANTIAPWRCGWLLKWGIGMQVGAEPQPLVATQLLEHDDVGLRLLEEAPDCGVIVVTKPGVERDHAKGRRSRLRRAPSAHPCS